MQIRRRISSDGVDGGARGEDTVHGHIVCSATIAVEKLTARCTLSVTT